MNQAADQSLTADLVLKAYHAGLFPMADSKDSDEVFWVEPKERGVILLSDFHTPKRLKRYIKNTNWTIAINRDFSNVIKECAARDDTWINKDIITVYQTLHIQGHVHSIEVYNETDHLIGGLYGLSIGGCFCGESMFSKEDNASKVALVALADRCIARGYTMIDTQFITDHLKQFGTITIPQADYLRRFITVRDEPIRFV